MYSISWTSPASSGRRPAAAGSGGPSPNPRTAWWCGRRTGSRSGRPTVWKRLTVWRSSRREASSTRPPRCPRDPDDGEGGAELLRPAGRPGIHATRQVISRGGPSTSESVTCKPSSTSMLMARQPVLMRRSLGLAGAGAHGDEARVVRWVTSRSDVRTLSGGDDHLRVGRSSRAQRGPPPPRSA